MSASLYCILFHVAIALFKVRFIAERAETAQGKGRKRISLHAQRSLR